MTNGNARKSVVTSLAAALALLAGVAATRAQDGAAATPALEIYGFAMLDMGYQSGQNDPDWFDVVRPTKLPSFENEFGEDGHFFAGVRQTRFGAKGFIPTSLGEIRTIFEFELFGTGVDAGQTTFRLRHAWGELGAFGAGQSFSPFMDIDVFPNSIEYWGPNGMVFFRNVQVRWMPLRGENELFVALERPGASGDAGRYEDRVELEGIKARFPLPDLSAHYRMNRGWGHVQVSGIVRQIKWDDTNDDGLDLSGDVLGWGAHVSTNVKFGKDVLRGSVVYGAGIQNYMNDAPADVGIGDDPDEIGEALPLLGLVAFYDHAWNDRFSTSIGYSRLDIDNSAGQADDAFKVGQYALVNLLYTPVPGVMVGGELQWGKRENNADGFSSDDLRFQFSAKYNFGIRLGGK